MGRRSINTTKSGKYMNPTDQARKEARKKELKKNKRQRQMVRAAVLKMKDPTQILEELQKIDEMEYNVLQPSPLNEKVLKEKRKKLRETFDRVLKMYDKDDPEKWVELKRQEMEYDKCRAHLISYYESVKLAQSVQVDDIPLPTLQMPENYVYGSMASQIPMPMDIAPPSAPMKPILKKDSVYKERPAGAEAPGVPPGPPPDYALLLLDADKPDITSKEKKSLRFSDLPDEGPPGEKSIPMPTCLPNLPDPAEYEGDAEPMEEDPETGNNAAPKPTSLQQRMLALSGQNIDDFMKEMEEVHRKRERDRAADLNARLTALKRTGGPRDSDSDSDNDTPLPPPKAVLPPDFILEPPGVEMRQMPPPLMPPGLRPPPLRVPLGPPPLRLPRAPGVPPGPPPGAPGAPGALARLLRPPGPPPGAPPRLLRPLAPPPKALPPVSVLMAAPQLHTKKDAQGLRPPPLRLPRAPGVPPGPPPGAPGAPGALARLLRPPGPPPGAPPRLLRPLAPPPKALPPVSVLMAAPQLHTKKDAQGATITAKPQIRNLSADVTRFVPSALRVKREDKKSNARLKPAVQRPESVPKQAPSKDDAYMQFMKEMEGLL